MQMLCLSLKCLLLFLKDTATSVCAKDVECTGKAQRAFWRENTVGLLTIVFIVVGLLDLVISIREV
jgi:hypothetical protein